MLREIQCLGRIPNIGQGRDCSLFTLAVLGRDPSVRTREPKLERPFFGYLPCKDDNKPNVLELRCRRSRA